MQKRKNKSLHALLCPDLGALCLTLVLQPLHRHPSHVFPSAWGGRLSTVQKAFRNARIRAGMPDLHFHNLRHTFASHWVMGGGDLYVLKDILGHKSIVMTQRYAHLSPAYKRTMVDRMEKMWEKAAADTAVQSESGPRVSRHPRVTNRILPSAEILPKPAATRV
jgi:integrase